MLKKYDKLLFLDKSIDGKKTVKRKSPIYKTVNYDVLEIENQYLGSMRWVLDKIKKMDSRRVDFFKKTIENNDKSRKPNKDRRVHEDVATFMQEGNKIII